MVVRQETSGPAVDIVPGQQTAATRTGQIVVGMDGSARSMAALEWAVAEARVRGCGVKIVMAWQHPQAYGAADVWGLGTDPSLDAAEVLASAADAEAERLAEQAAPARDVPMTWETVEGHPAEVLVGISGNADLLVVGSRGHGGFVGMLLGSVSQHVVAHAKCPVLVVPDPQRHDGEAG